jgi:CII-binding regulator of phage lambda lysogenization HflD
MDSTCGVGSLSLQTGVQRTCSGTAYQIIRDELLLSALRNIVLWQYYRNGRLQILKEMVVNYTVLQYKYM